MFGTMNSFLYALHKWNTSFCTARQSVLIWLRTDVIILKFLDQATRAAKLSRESRAGISSVMRTDDVGNSSLSKLIAILENTLDTDDESIDPSFDLDSSVRLDGDHLVHKKVNKSNRSISEVQ